MNTIVVNTLTGAVSEYDFSFQSITDTHAGSALGLYALGGDLDVLAPVIANVVTGRTLLDESAKKTLDMLYFSMTGSGVSTAGVYTESTSYSYQFAVRAAGESRCKPGRGIRENYFGFGYSNTDGAAFSIDRIEVLVNVSPKRKVA
jgi:hypothetical protein